MEDIGTLHAATALSRHEERPRSDCGEEDHRAIYAVAEEENCGRLAVSW